MEDVRWKGTSSMRRRLVIAWRCYVAAHPAVPSAAKDRQRRIFRELRIGLRKPAQIEAAPLRALDHAGEYAVFAETDTVRHRPRGSLFPRSAPRPRAAFVR